MTRRALGARVVGSILLVAITACASTPTPWPSFAAPVLATQTFSDPAGDVPVADLVGIHTVVTDEAAIIELEFATDDDRAEASVQVVIAEPPLEGTPICYGYIGPYAVLFGPDASADLFGENGEVIAALETAVDGPWMSVAVPLSMIGDPPTLFFAVTVVPSEGVAEGDLGEHSPDTPDACHAASLGP